MEPRHPSVILKEIKKVSELIIDNKRLMFEYPEEIGLELDDWSLESRKSELLKELKESNDYFNILMIDLTLKDDENSSPDLNKVGSFLTSLQNLITSLVQSGEGPVKKGAKTTDEIKDLSALEIIEATPGSLNIILKGKTKASLINSRSKEAFDKLNHLIKCKDNRDLIVGELKKLGNKPIIKYKEFLNVIMENNLRLELYNKFRPSGYEPAMINKKFAVSVYEVITETEPKTIPEIIEGNLGAVDTFSKKLTIKKEDKFLDGKKVEGKKIPVEFDEKYLSTIKEKLGKPVKIEVDLTKKYYELEDDTKETRELKKFIFN